MTLFRDLQSEIRKFSDIPPTHIPRRRPRLPCAGRLQQILDKHYGNVVGTGETQNCLNELVDDIKQFCRVTGRNFSEPTIPFNSVKPPKHTQWRVVWNRDAKGNFTKGGVAIGLVGYCPDTFEHFLGLLEELKIKLPSANISKATCGKVTKSHYIQGFTVVICPFSLGKRRPIKGFTEYDSIDFNY